MERISNQEDLFRRESWMEHMFIKCITAVNKKAGDKMVEAWNNGGWNVKLEVEGIEVPLQKIMKEWEEQFPRMLGEAARDLVKDKFVGLSEKFDETLERAQSAMIDHISKHVGVDISGREDD